MKTYEELAAENARLEEERKQWKQWSDTVTNTLRQGIAIVEQYGKTGHQIGGALVWAEAAEKMLAKKPKVRG